MARNESKSSRGFYIDKSGREYYLPAGIRRGGAGKGWKVQCMMPTWTYEVYVSDLAHGGIDASLAHALKIVGYQTDEGAVAPAFGNRVQRQIGRVEAMSVQYEDRYDLPLGIGYRTLRSTGTHQVYVSLGSKRIIRSVAIGDSEHWESVLSDFQTMRLAYLRAKAQQALEQVEELIG